MITKGTQRYLILRQLSPRENALRGPRARPVRGGCLRPASDPKATTLRSPELGLTRPKLPKAAHTSPSVLGREQSSEPRAFNRKPRVDVGLKPDVNRLLRRDAAAVVVDVAALRALPRDGLRLHPRSRQPDVPGAIVAVTPPAERGVEDVPDSARITEPSVVNAPRPYACCRRRTGTTPAALRRRWLRVRCRGGTIQEGR